MCKIKCNARDNKADIKNNTQHFDISGMSTKPTQNQVFKAKSQNQLRIKCIQAKITKPAQNQVYSSQNHKTNSESSVFKPKSASHTRDKKKPDIKNSTPATDALAK